MATKIIDPQTLYQNVLHVLQNGLRTSTYKLATMAALVDFCIEQNPDTSSATLDVSLAELSRRVITLYWDQLNPFGGVELRQSTQPRSRIFDEIEKLRSAANCPGDDPKLETAAKLAPGVFRRVVDEVAVCLAQQPLPRLQRTVGAARSAAFLYEDNFLHDNVTRAELARHRYAIQLKPGVAHGLAVRGNRIRQVVQELWIADVLRINRLTSESRAGVEVHLFGQALMASPAEKTTPALGGDRPKPKIAVQEATEKVSSSVFATRLNRLIASLPDYSSGEVAARIRQSGFPMTVGTLTRLQAGIAPVPSAETIEALARYFGVDPSYFLGQGDTSTAVSNTTTPTLPPRIDSSAQRRPPASRFSAIDGPVEAAADERTFSPDGEIWGQVFGDDLEDIASSCKIAANGCWIRSSETPVRCRPRGNYRSTADLPKMTLHRWAWIVHNGYSHVPIPTYLVQIRRTCQSRTCCNPQHLYAASPGGARLSNQDVSRLLRNGSGLGHHPAGGDFGGNRLAAHQGRVVLDDNIASVRSYCSIGDSGCWIARSSVAVACRTTADDRAVEALPVMAPHRWAWMITHGFTSSPLSSDEFHVRRRCSQKKCCNPEHLYLTDLSGQETSATEIVQLNKPNDRRNAPTRPGSGVSFASQLNALFAKSISPHGVPYTSSEVAAELQEDGLAISPALIETYRSGVVDAPNARVTEALAYFFNVEPDYFSSGSPTSSATDELSTTSDPAAHIPQSRLSEAKAFNIPIAELGRMISGLSETASECLERDPAQIQASRRLLSLLTRLGESLMEGGDNFRIGQPILERIVSEWDAATRDQKHQQLIAKLSHFLERE